MTALQNKVALVTGASRGIGAQIAKALGEAGARVVVNYAHSADAAEQVVADIRSKGGEALAVRADVSNAAEVRAMFDAAIAQFGKLDVLINNAGLIVYKKFEDTTEEDFDRVFATNVKGVFNTLQEAVKRLENGGRIVNFSSSTTRLLLPTYGVYCASKGAVEQFTRVLAKELGPRGVTVNTVSPGPTDTELFRQGKTPEVIARLAAMAAFNRVGEPEDIVGSVMFLVSDEAAWVTGQNLGVNGGVA